MLHDESHGLANPTAISIAETPHCLSMNWPVRRLLQDAFGGARGPVADALNLNAGVALAAATLAADAKEGVAMAQDAQRRWDR